jgi:hypothetical protein
VDDISIDVGQTVGQLGVTRARMSQILNLLNLPPRVQERLLLGDLHLSERPISALAAGAEWELDSPCP